MRKFLFASHVWLAEGMKSSLELVLGPQEQVDVLSAYTEEPYNIQNEIEKKLNALADGDELIVITDLFGGSVNNEFISAVAGKKNVHLVAGLNLAFCVNIVVRKDDERDTPLLIREVLEEARQSLQYCNDPEKEKQEIKDEDF